MEKMKSLKEGMIMNSKGEMVRRKAGTEILDMLI
jgi:hypothetical protein